MKNPAADLIDQAILERVTRRPLQPFDVVPGHVLRDEYGYNAEN